MDAQDEDLSGFPDDYLVHRPLKDGRIIVIRPIAPGDKAAIRSGFHSLSDESRVRRFHGVVTEPSEATLRYLTEVDQNSHVALVATIESPDLKSETGVGVARFIRLPGDPSTAECAVTVIDSAQGQGVGRHLLTELTRVAKHKGVRRFRAEVLPSNTPVRAILDAVGAHPAPEKGEGSLAFDVELGPEHRSALFEVFRAVASNMTHAIERMRQSATKLLSEVASRGDSSARTVAAPSATEDREPEGSK